MMKAIVLKKFGDSKVLKVSNEPIPKIKNNQVLVNIKFAGVNYADILSRQGLYNWMGKVPYTLGLEGSGVITRVGKATTKFKVGDKVVIGGKSGTYAEYAVKDENAVFRIPSFLTLEQACILPGAWLTAWVAMLELARVRKGEKILIHSAAGGVGIASIEIAKALGIKVFGTASKSKHEYLKSQGVIPLEYDNFDSILLKIDEKPDFILESVGGSVHEISKKILAPLGRMVTLGASSIKIKNKLNPFAWIKAWQSLPRIKRSDISSQGYMSLHIGYLFENNSNYLEPCWYRMISFMEQNRLVPLINKNQILPMSQANLAHDLIDQRKNIGKVILIPSK